MDVKFFDRVDADIELEKKKCLLPDCDKNATSTFLTTILYSMLIMKNLRTRKCRRNGRTTVIGRSFRHLSLLIAIGRSLQYVDVNTDGHNNNNFDGFTSPSCSLLLDMST